MKIKSSQYFVKPILIITLLVIIASGCTKRNFSSTTSGSPTPAPAPPAPDFKISPSNVLLLTAPHVNQLTTQFFTITNSSATAVISSVAINTSSIPSSITIQPKNCNNVLPNMTCQIEVDYTPVTTSSISLQSIAITAAFTSTSAANTTISHNASLLASVGADFLITPSTLSFNNTQINHPASQFLTITNISGTATMQSIAVDTSSIPSSISIQPQPCQNIAPLGTCKIAVTFNPSDTSAISISPPITVTFSNSSGSQTTITHSVPITAQGSLPPPSTFTLTPSTLAFGPTLIGSQTTKTFTINYTSTNQTAQSFVLTSSSNVAIPSSITSNISQCTNLSNGGSCTISVSYSPTDNTSLPASVIVTAALSGTPSSTTQTLYFQGNGLSLASPSPSDIPFLVGWFIYQPPDSAAVVNLSSIAGTPGFSSCKSLATYVANGYHGDSSIFCYEPSGANGLTSNPSAQKFSILTNYILNNLGSSVQPIVQSLASIFPTSIKSALPQTDTVQYAQFYYMMAYLYISPAINLKDSANNFGFSCGSLDDGASIIVNGNIVANPNWSNTYLFDSMNMHFIVNSFNSFLNSGPNTIVVLWVDDFCCYRSFTNPYFTFQEPADTPPTAAPKPSQIINIYEPYVVSGYCYYGISGIGIPGCKVSYSAQGNTSSATSDASGFYSFQSLPANVPILITFTYNGQTPTSQVVTLDPHQPQTAAVMINQAF